MDINLPDVLAEVAGGLRPLRKALVTNDVAVLDELFWNSPHTLRYGVDRKPVRLRRDPRLPRRRPAQGLARDVLKTVITTYGRDFATANIEFRRAGSAKTGRQSQTWMRTPEGWRVVAAHVSLLGMNRSQPQIPLHFTTHRRRTHEPVNNVQPPRHPQVPGRPRRRRHAGAAPLAFAQKPITVGVIYVGPRDDYGYNQAQAQAAAELKKMPGVKVVEEENVPETAAVQKTMTGMIAQDGATLLFPTSFGYFDPHMLAVAAQVPRRALLPLRRHVDRGQAPEEHRPASSATSTSASTSTAWSPAT